MGIKINKFKKFTKRDLVFFFVMSVWLSYLFCALHHSLMYSDPDYVCRHMARDLETNLEKIGFDVKLVSNHKHMWISVNGFQIDSVSLFPIQFTPHDRSNVTFYENYGEYQILRNST